MSEFEQLVLRREAARMQECCRYAGFLISAAGLRPYDPGLCDRIETALEQARRSEEVVAVLRDKLEVAL